MTILFKSSGILDRYLSKNYQALYAKYNYMKCNRDLIADLEKNGFLLKIEIAESKSWFSYEISDDNTHFLLFVDKINQHFRDHNEIDGTKRIEELLTIDNLCDIMKLSRPTVYKLIKEEKLKTITIFDRKRVRYSDYLALINNCKS